MTWFALDRYLYAAANMYAFVFGVDQVCARPAFEAIISRLNLTQPGETPGTSDNEFDEESELVCEDALKSELAAVDVTKIVQAQPHHFHEKSNFCIDFVTAGCLACMHMHTLMHACTHAATNLRSWNYHIKSSTRHTVKVTAGHVVPALVTTTGTVCGLVTIEFCKLMVGFNLGNDKFFNSNFNLAGGSAAFSIFNPLPPSEQSNKRTTNLSGSGAFLDR